MDTKAMRKQLAFTTSILPCSTSSSSSATTSSSERLLRYDHRHSKTRYSTGKTRAFMVTAMELKVGDRVRVLDKGILMYHFPGKINEPVPVSGLTGTVITDVSILNDVKLSATSPYIVKLDDYPKSRTHFSEDEVEVVTEEQSQQ